MLVLQFRSMANIVARAGPAGDRGRPTRSRSLYRQGAKKTRYDSMFGLSNMILLACAAGCESVADQMAVHHLRLAGTVGSDRTRQEPPGFAVKDKRYNHSSRRLICVG